MLFHDVIVLASRCWQFFLCFPMVNRWAVCLSRLRRYLSCISINHLTFFSLHAGTFKYPVVFRYAFSCHSFLNIKMQTDFFVFLWLTVGEQIENRDFRGIWAVFQSITMLLFCQLKQEVSKYLWSSSMLFHDVFFMTSRSWRSFMFCYSWQSEK